MITVESQKVIERLLVESGAVAADQLGNLKLQALQQKKPLLSFVAEQKLIDEEQMTKILAQAAGVPYVNLQTSKIDPAIMKLLPKDLATNYLAVPFGMMKGKLGVAMLDASNTQAIDFIAKTTGQQLAVFMASRPSIESTLAQYPADDVMPVRLAENPLAKDKTIVPANQSDLQEIAKSIEQAPVTKSLNSLLDYAVKVRASDIHIEPREKDLKIRCRVDGILQETMILPKTVEAALVSRVKILTNLKIDEHRIPQDGQFSFKTGTGKEVDARVAVSPVVNGEQVVIRLLDETGALIDLSSIGLMGRGYKEVEAGIAKPYGMILSTGPTGSGKTTSLYAIIKQLNDSTVNIVTLEDPIEYRIDNINQIQVNNAVGLTFAGGLRSILRQDPNIIMVGEIRDKETADLAVQAALTGHIVLSSLHTNSAAGVLPRMLDMNIEPFLLASTINTVLGQRLVRKVCDNCREPFQANQAQVVSIKTTLEKILPKDQSEAAAKAKELGYETLPLAGQNAYTLYKGRGCADCTNGYRGRIGIFEVFGMNSAIEKLLVKRATTAEIHQQAVADGMLTMKQEGYLKALGGITTLEEVARVAADM